MAIVIEEKMIKCDGCGITTKHYRNNTESSGFMILIHLLLSIMTMGVWLGIIIVWKVLFAKIGGWKCNNTCGQ